MNREQMIAHLTIQGWVPYESSAYCGVINRELNLDAYTCTVSYDDGFNRDLSVLFSNQRSCDWVKISTGHLKRLAQLIERGWEAWDHES